MLRLRVSEDAGSPCSKTEVIRSLALRGCGKPVDLNDAAIFAAESLMSPEYSEERRRRCPRDRNVSTIELPPEEPCWTEVVRCEFVDEFGSYIESRERTCCYTDSGPSCEDPCNAQEDAIV